MSTGDKAYFCPNCGGASVDVSSLEGGTATCTTCSWSGSNKDLVVHLFSHEHGQGDQVLRTFAKEFQLLMGKEFSLFLARFLSKWGFFLTQPVQKEELATYLQAVAKAAILAILEVRREFEKKRTTGDSNGKN